MNVGINQLLKMIQMIIMFALNCFFWGVRGRSNGDPFLFGLFNLAVDAPGRKLSMLRKRLGWDQKSCSYAAAIGTNLEMLKLLGGLVVFRNIDITSIFFELQLPAGNSLVKF